MALDYLLQVGEFLGEVPFQPVVIYQRVGIGQLFAWRSWREENEECSKIPIWESGTHPASLSSLTDIQELGEWKRYTDQGLPISLGTRRPAVSSRGGRWREVRNAVDQPEAPFLVQEQHT